MHVTFKNRWKQTQVASLRLHHPATLKLLRLKGRLFLWQQVGRCFQSLPRVFAVNRSVRLKPSDIVCESSGRFRDTARRQGWKRGLAVMRNAAGGCVLRDQGDAGSAGVLLTALSASRWPRRALSQMFWPIEVVPGHSKKGAAESGCLQLGSAYRQSLMSVTLMCSRRRLRMFLRRVLLFWSPNLCRFQRKKASFCDRGIVFFAECRLCKAPTSAGSLRFDRLCNSFSSHTLFIYL